MSTHEDWLNAKRRRDNAAYMLAKAFIAGQVGVANEEGVKFAAADAEMERIEKELDGRAGK